MRIRRIKLVLPPTMRQGAARDAREIVAAVAQALSKHGGTFGPLRIETSGAGRPATHIAHDAAAATHRAAGASAKRGA